MQVDINSQYILQYLYMYCLWKALHYHNTPFTNYGINIRHSSQSQFRRPLMFSHCRIANHRPQLLWMMLFWKPMKSTSLSNNKFLNMKNKKSKFAVKTSRLFDIIFIHVYGTVTKQLINRVTKYINIWLIIPYYNWRNSYSGGECSAHKKHYSISCNPIPRNYNILDSPTI